MFRRSERRDDAPDDAALAGRAAASQAFLALDDEQRAAADAVRTADELGGARRWAGGMGAGRAGGRPRDGGLPRHHRAVPARRHRPRRGRRAGRRARVAGDRGGAGDDPPLPFHPRAHARRGRAPAARAAGRRCRRRAARWSGAHGRAGGRRLRHPVAAGGRTARRGRAGRGRDRRGGRHPRTAGGGRPDPRTGAGGGHARHRGAPGRGRASARRSRSVATRRAAAATKADRIPPALSALRREFSEPCSLDLADAEKKARAALAAVDRAIAQAHERADAGEWDDAADAIAEARAQLGAAEQAHDSVAGRLADLREVRADPGKLAADTRFVLRDAQRLVVDRGLVKRFGPILDAQSVRLQNAQDRLTGVHPDYWLYLSELRGVRTRAQEVVARPAPPAEPLGAVLAARGRARGPPRPRPSA